MTRQLGHVVVLGASMGGLLAARVLSDHAERVTVIERDDLRRPGDRPGVPQGRHVHALLARGQEIFEELLPGVTDEFRADGAISVQALAEIRTSLRGRTLAQGDAGYRLVQASRPLLEWRVRQRVSAIANITLTDRTTVTSLLSDATGARVTGARIAGAQGAERELPADLVVSCLGRFGPILDWLRHLGYDPPEEEGVPIDMMYASRQIRLPDGSPAGDKEIIAADTDAARAMALFEIEDGRHILTLIGYGDHHPPTDDEGFWQFAASVAPRDVATAFARAEDLSDVATYRYRANLRRRYERLQRFPDGLLVLGDAVCSFSPAFGQGMTMSAIQAVELERVLSTGLRDLAPRYFGAAAHAVDVAWLITKVFDQSMPHVPAPWYQPLVDPAIDVALLAATRDTGLAVRAARIMGLLDRPTAALTPGLAAGFARGLLTATASAVAGRARSGGGTDFEPDADVPARGFHALEVADVTRLTPDSVAITFSVPEPLLSTFAFTAGQHVTVRGLHRGAPIRRTYSVCDPEGSGRLRIAVKQQPGGVFSTYALNRLRPGDRLQVAPPAGRFLPGPLAPGRRCSAVAAGSGIAPVLSIMATTLAADHEAAWTLHDANPTRDDVMLAEEIKALTASHPGRVTVIHHLSRERCRVLGDNARLGRLDPAVLRAHEADEWFCCGPPDFITSVAQALRRQGLPASRLHVELFTRAAHSAPARRTGPPSRVVLCGAGGELVVDVSPGERILNAALELREDLPYSCLGGSCGSCLADVTSGEITMEDVPFMALTDDDRAAGRVLTCLASPVTPEVRLTFSRPDS